MSTRDATSSAEHPPRTEAAAEVSETQIRSGSSDVEVCPDEDEVLGFLDRRLDPDRAGVLEAHVDRCPSCRRMIGQLAQDQGARSDPTPQLETIALSPGDQVDHFRIEALLGRGGMGEVYAAQDTTLRRKVALKLISRTLADSSETRARIVIEARAMARLSHPNIAAIFSAGEHEGRPYLAMEFLDGLTLRERLDLGPLGIVDVVRIAAAIISALAHAHHYHVVHRDLKPQNIILGADRPRVVDFGLAKLEPAPDFDSSFITDDGGIRGTPAYIAPEHWRGQASTKASDLWAFGVILYEMISGKRPYREMSAAGYAARVSSPDPTPPLTRISGAPEPLIKVVERCLSKDPAARGTAEEAQRVILALAAEESLRVAADLDEAASRWESRGEPADVLWDAALVTRAERALSARAVPIPGSAARFLSASIERVRKKERQRSRRLSLLGGAASTFGLIAAALAVVSFESATRAKRNEREVEAQRARALIEGAAAALDQGAQHEARAKLRSGLEIGDDVRARAVWAALSRDPLLWRRKLSSGLFDVALSPDGNWIAAGAQDHTVYLLDARTLAVRSLRGHRDQVFKVAFSPDGRWLASSSWSGEIRLWDLTADGVRVLRGSKRAVALAFGGDFLWAAESEGSIRVYPIDGREPFSVGPGGAKDIVIDGDLAWVAYTDGRIRALDSKSVRETIEIASSPISSLAVDSRSIAAGGDDGKVYLVSRSSGVRRVFEGHAARVVRVRFAGPDRLVSIAEDKSARLFDLTTGRSVLLGTDDSAVWGLAVDRTVAITAHVDGALRAFDLDRAMIAPAAGAHTDGVTSVSLGDDGRIYSGGYDRQIRVWDASLGAPIAVIRGHEGTIYGLAQRGARLVSASHDRTVRLWDLPSGRQKAVLAGHEGGVYGVAIDPRGEWIASAGTDRTVRLWSFEDGRAKDVLRGHESGVVSIAWSPNGDRLASGGADKRIVIWDRSGKQLRNLIGHEGSVWGVAFHADDKRLISGGYDQTVRVWDLATGKHQVAARFDARVYSVNVTGDRAFVACADGLVHVIDLAAGAVTSWSGHRSEVNQVRASGDRVASVSDDGTVRLWSSSGAPKWRGVLLDGDTLYSHRGFTAQLGALDRRLIEQGLIADRSKSFTCLSTTDRALELWEGDRRIFSVEQGPVNAVAALDTACVILSGASARLFAASGASKELISGARALAVDTRGIAVATEERIVRFDNTGSRSEDLPIAAGVTAIAAADDGWFLGFENGRIERWSGGKAAAVSFESPPGGPVSRIAIGPMKTVVAGYSSGELALWSQSGGAVLHHRRLHGPLLYLSTGGGTIHAATELGDVLEPIEVFRPNYCDLLEQVRAEIPVIWGDGLPVVATGPEEHPCSKR